MDEASHRVGTHSWGRPVDGLGGSSGGRFYRKTLLPNATNGREKVNSIQMDIERRCDEKNLPGDWLDLCSTAIRRSWSSVLYLLACTPLGSIAGAHWQLDIGDARR